MRSFWMHRWGLKDEIHTKRFLEISWLLWVSLFSRLEMIVVARSWLVMLHKVVILALTVNTLPFYHACVLFLYSMTPSISENILYSVLCASLWRNVSWHLSNSCRLTLVIRFATQRTQLVCAQCSSDDDDDRMAFMHRSSACDGTMQVRQRRMTQHQLQVVVIRNSFVYDHASRAHSGCYFTERTRRRHYHDGALGGNFAGTDRI